MKLSWKKITSLPSHVLEKDTEEVEVVYKETKKEKQKFSRKKKDKEEKQKFSRKKKDKEVAPEEWLPESNQGQLVVDIYDDEEKNILVLQSTIAGVKSEALDITVEPDLIVIRGKREKEKIKESHHYYYQECFWGNFSRTLVLPVRIVPDKVKASLKNGILTVILPKAGEDKGGENIKVE
ncbi:Hsp20/alpha crystallin family protein [Patescibacteria group bacterium AH-259-L07]|nr:Hsp20/alpha crystallin family protein [Patescibacteria group bacterium AH-259-L07]